MLTFFKFYLIAGELLWIFILNDPACVKEIRDTRAPIGYIFGAMMLLCALWPLGLLLPVTRR
jgi:hypothetical protein